MPCPPSTRCPSDPRPRRRIIALACLLALMANPRAEEPAPLVNPEGYRIDAFVAPVPQSVPGAATVGTAEVQAMIAAGDAVLIDVLPAPPMPVGLGDNERWLPPPHRNIPGSTWLPNVGYGSLSDDLAEYLQQNLRRVTGGDHARRLIVYCRADCWMSWNAAKRIAAAGYTAVYWYPEGTTGWEKAGLPLETRKPARRE